LRVSVITPSFNQARFIERTIRSVLQQDHPDLEYIVLDGGSTDGTIEILDAYSDRITWVSEKDQGQSHAINKGLAIATGEIVAYLNSDDTYEPGALSRVAGFFHRNPESKWAYGKCRIIDEQDHEIRKAITLYKNLLSRSYSYRKLLSENFICQPATFWKRELLPEIGFLNEAESLCMDYEFWLRIGQKYPAGVIDGYLACFRYYPDSKSWRGIEKQFQDELRLARRYGEGHGFALFIHRINYHKIVWAYRLLNASPRPKTVARTDSGGRD